MIRTFRDDASAALWNREVPGRDMAEIAARARKVLEILNGVQKIEHLMLFPGLRFHGLGGDRKGQYALRVNDKWRVTFEWKDGDAYNVEVSSHYGK